MAGYRPKDKSLTSKIYNEVEKSFSKVFFSRVFLANDEKGLATIMGVKPNPKDYLFFALASLYVTPQLAAHTLALQIPGLNKLADKSLLTSSLSIIG